MRQDIRERLAYNYRFQRVNLNKRERVALKRLGHNKDIIIKPADKGGATVIINTGITLRKLKNTNFFTCFPKSTNPIISERPVISSINSHTEKLSAYVDEFLTPLAQALPSHTRDTTDFIILLKNLGRVPENSILATLDVSSLYQRIPTHTYIGLRRTHHIQSKVYNTGKP